MKNTSKQFLGRWGKVGLTVALLTFAGWLTSRQLRDLNWADVSAASAEFSGTTIAIALLCALIGYIAVSQYDVVGRFYTGHKLAVRRVMAISFIGFTFSLNIGAFIGGMGFRYRLYSNADLSAATITKIIGLSVLGNWSGYVLLAGLLFTFAPPHLPPSWNASTALLQGLGALLLVISATYIGLCWRYAGRSRDFGRITLTVPSIGIAAIQFALSVVSWCANATILYILLPDAVSWNLVLSALVTGSLAAILAHVPGGLGVIELVFLTLLGHLAPESAIVAALLGYRCVYYLLPLLLALLMYISIEVRHMRASKSEPVRQDYPV